MEAIEETIQRVIKEKNLGDNVNLDDGLAEFDYRGLNIPQTEAFRWVVLLSNERNQIVLKLNGGFDADLEVKMLNRGGMGIGNDDARYSFTAEEKSDARGKYMELALKKQKHNLRELSECIGEVLTLNTGGRHGSYKGVLEVDNSTNPQTYMLRTEGIYHRNLGSLKPNRFNTTHRVNEKNEIVRVEAA